MNSPAMSPLGRVSGELADDALDGAARRLAFHGSAHFPWLDQPDEFFLALDAWTAQHAYAPVSRRETV